MKGSVLLHKDGSEETLYSYIQSHKDELLGNGGEFDCLPYLLKVSLSSRGLVAAQL